MSGEAVITGHRKSPGNGWQVSPVTVFRVRRHVVLFYPHLHTDTSHSEWERERGAVTLASILMQERGKSQPSRAHIAALRAAVPPRESQPLSRLFSRWSFANLSTCKTSGSTDSPVTQKWLSEARTVMLFLNSDDQTAGLKCALKLITSQSRLIDFIELDRYEASTWRKSQSRLAVNLQN